MVSSSFENSTVEYAKSNGHDPSLPSAWRPLLTADVILGIDASNLRHGGGVTHLVEILRAAEPKAAGFDRVIVWAGRSTSQRIENRSWLSKPNLDVLNQGLLARARWQRFELSKLVRSKGCDVLFVPGGSYAGDYRPIVTMSRNLLPFEWRELARFGCSWLALKLCLLRLAQTRSLRHADGVIFLTAYARAVVSGAIGGARGLVTIIPHGIDARFIRPPRTQRPIGEYSRSAPMRLLYVSIIDMYKHQWHVAEAVAALRAADLPVALDLIGPAYPPALRRLRATLERLDPGSEFLRYEGPAAHEELHAKYAEADICIFASSCENMPNILLEGMASGLPIACSRRGPMPEVLGDAGVYFDPEVPADIARALRELIDSPALRAQSAQRAYERACSYSWKRCAHETFDFLAQIARGGAPSSGDASA